MKSHGDNPVAMVTGANRGIGRVIARELGRHGYRVIVNWYDDPAMANEFAGELSDLNIEHHFFRADISKSEEVARMFASAVDRFGRLDLLVNNAAIQIDSPAMEMREQDFDRVLGVNLRGAFLCAQQAGRIMAAKGRGRIVNISSIHEFVPKPGFLSYAVAKAGLGMLTKSLALELAPLGVVVIGIAPGGVKSTMADRVTDVLINSTPVRAIAEPEEVAAAVLYAASDAARLHYSWMAA